MLDPSFGKKLQVKERCYLQKEIAEIMTNRDRVNQEFHVMAFSFHFAAPNQLLLLYPDIMPKCAEYNFQFRVYCSLNHHQVYSRS